MGYDFLFLHVLCVPMFVLLCTMCVCVCVRACVCACVRVCVQESTASEITRHFEGEQADLVVCDGAPDGEWA